MCSFGCISHWRILLALVGSGSGVQGLQYWGQPWSTGDNPGQDYAAPLRKTVAPFLSLFQAVKGLAGQKVISFPMAIREALEMLATSLSYTYRASFSLDYKELHKHESGKSKKVVSE